MAASSVPSISSAHSVTFFGGFDSKRSAIEWLREQREGGKYRQEIVDDLLSMWIRGETFRPEPEVAVDFDMVWVLSARSTFASHLDVDHLPRDPEDKDPEDEYLRMLRGIQIADGINALKAGKEIAELTDEDRVTPIFYNGKPEANVDLAQAIAEGIFPYPTHLVIIRPIEPGNTLGQVRCMAGYLHEENPDCKHIALVSSAYHLPRVARLVGKDSPQTQGEGCEEMRAASFYLYGSDRVFQRPGILLDVGGECDAMTNYAHSMAPQVCENTFLTQNAVLAARDTIAESL